MLKPKQSINVSIENGKVNVAGRTYDSPHTLLIGAEGVKAEISHGKVRVEANFASLPSVESQGEEIVKVYRPDVKYEVDTLGEKLDEYGESGEGYTLKGRVVSIKFESDEYSEGIVVKIPRLARLKVKELRISSARVTALNIITIPFTVGILTTYNSTCKVKVLGEAAEVQIT